MLVSKRGPPTAITNYPTVTRVTMAPAPTGAGLLDPCAGVAADGWCPTKPSRPGG